MYTVMKAAEQEGKGLLDLMDCIKQCNFEHRNSEDFLRMFWLDWKSKHSV